MHLKTTLIFNNRPVYLGKKNLGEVLNMLAESGWEIDKNQAGENPFEQTLTNVIKRLQQKEDQDYDQAIGCDS